MKFDFGAFWFTLAFVAFSASVSLGENTFKNRRLTMDFLHHGGMYGDFFLLSVVNGLVSPYLAGQAYILPILVVSLLATLTIHAAWEQGMRRAGMTCHMFPVYQSTTWRENMSQAGWLHVMYMTCQIGLIIAYIFSPMPTTTVYAASSILTVHVFLGTVQPGWYCSGKLWTAGNFAPPIICAALIWIVGAIKIRSA